MFNRSVTSWWQVKRAQLLFQWGRAKRIIFVGVMVFGAAMVVLCMSQNFPGLLP